MASPNGGHDPAENALKNTENEPSNACEAEKELPLGDSNNISQVETNVSAREPISSSSQENTDLQIDNSISETEKMQSGRQDEELIEASLPLQIPIPRKLIFPRLRLFRIIYLSIPQPQTHENKTLYDKILFYPGKMEMTISDYFHNSISDKILHPRFLLWLIPFITIHEVSRMIIRLLCGRDFSQPECRQHNTWVKQKYVAVLAQPNFVINIERSIIFGRPLRVYYHHQLIERMTHRKTSKSYQNKNGNHPSVKPGFNIPPLRTQNIAHRKAFKINLRTRHKLRLVITTYNNNWRYVCPICQRGFNNFYDLKHHSCSFFGN
ncbi:CPX chromosomal region candidate gene 1 protein [Acomys russatus]|uniref:CPX chromosomal region candidate gene 1 protein n=1 Tax=Acomys russatus TaxID=60746 RepID=UPI0021E3036D|nr:CPX chromosomal region candidate gene 1 protein [Acomys russatus]